MPKSFLHLSSIERSKILRSLTTPLSRPSTILEKDVWGLLGFTGFIYYA